jgi:CRISPR-associated protein Csh2
VNKRVYGIIGIRAKHANWNADFSGFPKSTGDGDFFGSDKALKYPMKKMWENNGEKVLYTKSMILVGEDYRPRTLKERYEQIHDTELKSKKAKDAGTPKKEVLENLFNSVDVKQFGATFAEEGNNFSITGAVQISQGFNKYENMSVEEQPILSPFGRIKDGENTDQSSLGTKITANEAHYFYHFVINPRTYKDYVNMEVTEGYTEADYNKFKEASLISATAFNTNAKVGCDNEFTMFIEVEEGVYLPDLTSFVTINELDGDRREIFLNLDLLKKIGSKVKSIEIYYNDALLEIKGNIPKGVKYFNIFTKEIIGE